MTIDTDTQIHTLLNMAEYIHDELEQLDGCAGFNEDMSSNALDYKRAFENFREAWVESRRERNAL